MTPEFHAEVGFWNNSFYAELATFGKPAAKPTQQSVKEI
jgi:hypothetical protein